MNQPCTNKQYQVSAYEKHNEWLPIRKYSSRGEQLGSAQIGVLLSKKNSCAGVMFHK